MDYRERIDRMLDETRAGGQRGRAIFLRLIQIDPDIDFPGILAAMPKDDQEIIHFVVAELERANQIKFFAD